MYSGALFFKLAIILQTEAEHRFFNSNQWNYGSSIFKSFGVYLMKRSEMINELVLAIDDTDRMTRKVLSRKDIVEAVLDRVEELGMLPPKSEDKGMGPTHSWEPECVSKCCGGGCHED